jgi:hypothetical protein
MSARRRVMAAVDMHRVEADDVPCSDTQQNREVSRA